MRKRFSTRLLMTCAALGVATGVLLIPAYLVMTVLMTAAPLVVLALQGAWFLPPMLALALLRTPGAGALTSTIAGLACVPFTGYGWAAVGMGLMWGAIAELPFLLTLYRVWRAWLFVAGAAVIGAAAGVPTYTGYGIDQMAPLTQAAALAMMPLTTAVFTVLALVLAKGLAKAGVAAGTGRDDTAEAV